MELIKGKPIAESVLTEIKKRIEKQSSKPKLAVVMVGNDEASQIYVNLKEKAARRVGIGFEKAVFADNVEEAEVIRQIEKLNKDDEITGIIVQLPLPARLNKEKIINAIAPQKDVDGFHLENRNRFLEGREAVFPVFPKAIVRMIEFAEKNAEKLSPKKAVVVCNSSDFGEIMKKALEKIGVKSEFIFRNDLKKTEQNDYAKIILRRADIIVTACGDLNLINAELVKDGAIIIDGGIVKKNGKVFGDVDIDSFAKTNCKISPVPGGVGPVTVATLLENVCLANK